MNLQAILSTNGAGILLLLILYYISRTRILRRRVEDRIYTILIFGLIAACVTETLTFVLDGQVFPGFRIVSHFLNTYLFSANMLLAFSVLVYVDLGLYNDPGRIMRCYTPQIAAGCVLLAVNVVNWFVPVTYRITEQNVYERMPFGYVYYAVILYYFVSGILLTRRYRRENGAIAFFNIHLFLLPVLIGLVLQLAFYGLSLAWLSAAIGLVGLFMMQQNEMAYLDVLTGIYNRQYMSYILSSWVSSGKSFAGVMLDIDGFKELNDTCGHSEGDQALIRVAELMKKAQADNELVFRFAGDEFIVLKLTDSPDALDGYMDRLDRLLEEYNRGGASFPLRISSGKGFDSRGDVDSFMREMDRQMYRMKAERRGASGTDGRVPAG